MGNLGIWGTFCLCKVIQVLTEFYVSQSSVPQFWGFDRHPLSEGKCSFSLYNHWGRLHAWWNKANCWITVEIIFFTTKMCPDCYLYIAHSMGCMEILLLGRPHFLTMGLGLYRVILYQWLIVLSVCFVSCILIFRRGSRIHSGLLLFIIN